MNKFFKTHRIAASAVYASVLMICFGIVLLKLLELSDQNRSVDQSRKLLTRLEEAQHAPIAQRSMGDDGMPPGSPLLEGPTSTVASAALLQRVLGAVTRVGGAVVSSGTVSQGAPSNRFLKVNVICELKQEDLQPLLYDVEAGMPFLFVDQLIVETPVPGAERKTLHVSLDVSALWPGGK
jgi:general secretion pathway protein M